MENNNSLNYKRPSWDEYFLLIVDAVSKRATCSRGKSGCIITKDKRILATGYVGAPANAKDCYTVGHLFKQLVNENGVASTHCIRTIHAEQNAIAQAAKYGISVKGGTLYCSMEPCFDCAKLILASGITKVIANNMYHSAENTRALLKDAKIDLIVINKEVLKYD